MNKWYQFDYEPGVYYMACDDINLVIKVLKSVYAPVNDHHPPHTPDEACEAWDNHYAYEEEYDPNPPRTNSWIGPSVFGETPCEFAFEDEGMRAYYVPDLDNWLDFHTITVYHMFHPIRKGYKNGIVR